MVGLPISTSNVVLKIRQFIEKHRLIKPDSTLVVGLSGGPDSVFLLIMLKVLQAEYNLTLIAAHLDHEWRKDSAQDVLFCAELARKLDCQFVSKKASAIVIPKKYNGSKEELGRQLRRQFLEEIAAAYNAKAIALAHHADDQQETFFFRLIRGATIAGLSAMRPACGIYIRPLLSLYKAEILEYLHQQKIAYCVDPTNTSDVYLRNSIRLNVIPALRATDNRFDKNFSKTVAHLQETDLFIARLADMLFQEITSIKDNTLWLDTKKFFAIDSFLHKRLVLLWLCHARVPFAPSTRFFQEIIRFLQQPGSKTHTIHALWYLVKKKGFACINQQESTKKN